MIDNNKVSNIPCRLHNVGEGGVAGADEVIDDKSGLTLEELVGNKDYTPAAYSGMGRVVLKKNMVNGVNTLTQDMFYKGGVGSRVPNTNTIYIIRYDYTLKEDITIPANCVLEFDGGSVNGNKLISNHTELAGEVKGNALYGRYYRNGKPLDYTYNYEENKDYIVQPLYTFSDYALGLDVLNYQSIAKWDKYFILLCHPATGDELLIMRVFDSSDWSYVGEVTTSVLSHANGCTLVGNNLYVCPCRANRANISVFDIESIISALLVSGSTTATPTEEINIYSKIPATDGLSIESIDYDATHNEFVLAVQRTIYVVDENFDLIRTCINYVTDCLDRFGIKIGIQDITAKNGLVYAWAWFYGEGLTSYPICVVVDTIEDEVVNVLNVPDNYINTEPEGAVKDINDASKTYSIIKAPVPGADVNAINIVEISKKRNVANSISFANEPFFADDSYYLKVYVDNSSTKSLEDGSTNFPFKTLGNAIAALRTKSKNIAFFLKKTSTPYVGKFGNVVGKSIRLIGNSGTPNVYVSARLTDVSFRTENINFVLDKNDAKADYISEDDDKFAIRLEHSSLYLVAGCSINNNAPQTEDNVTDGIGFCYGVNSFINSRVGSIYNIPFYVMGGAVTINMGIGSLINIGYLFYKNYGFNVNLNTQPALNVVSSWDLTAFAQRPLAKPMSLAISDLERAMLLILQYKKLNLNSGDGQLIYRGDETTYTSINFSTELKELFSDMGISIDDLNGKPLRDTYIYRYEKSWAVSENGIQFGKGIYWNLGTTKVDIYVNNGSAQDKEDGSSTYPFKTLQKAIDVLRPEINDVTIHLTKTATPYVGNFGDVISKAINIIGSASYTPLYLSGTFYNSSLEIDAANIQLDAEHDYITYDGDKVAIMYYNSSFIVKNNNNTGINHNENGSEVDNNNTVGLMCAFNSTMDISFAYINDVPFLAKGENVSIGLRIAGLTNIDTLFNKNFGFDVNLVSQPSFDNINNWSITNFSSRNLAKPMVLSANGIEAAMRAPLQFAKLKIKNGDAKFIYTGTEDTYDTQSLSQAYITAFTNIKGSTPTFKGRMIKGIYVYNSSAKWMAKEDGTILGKAIKGSTVYRPNADYMAIPQNLLYYDETISKPIWWNGTAWVDATGATV